MHVPDPGHRAHRRQVACAHGAEEAMVAVARNERHAPAHARDEIADISQCGMFACIAIDQNSLPAVFVHLLEDIVEAQTTLIDWKAVLEPDIGSKHDRGMHRLHWRPQTAMTSNCALHSDSDLAPSSATTTVSPHIR